MHTGHGVDAAIALALLASTLYGAADFCGGLASRQSTALTVAAVAQGFGIVVLAGVLLISPRSPFAPADVVWGAAAGICGALGITLFYQALKVGRMSVVAPITAATGDVVPVLVGFAMGERPSALVVLGFALALGSIVLVGQDQQTTSGSSGRSVLVALAGGLAIGMFLVCLRRTSPGAGLWPVLFARAVSLSLLLGATRIGRQSLRVSDRKVLLIVAAAGILDTTANACYVIAVHQGSLGVVATLASLYPAVTVVLAWWFLRERLRIPQYVGLVLCTAAIALISLG